MVSNLPTGYTLSGKSVSVTLGGGSISLFTDASSTTSFTYTTPSISGATMSVVASATKGSLISQTAKRQLATGASGVTIDLRDAPQLSLPVNAATNIATSTSFSWTPFTGGISMVVFNGPAGKPDVSLPGGVIADAVFARAPVPPALRQYILRYFERIHVSPNGEGSS